MQAWGLEGWGLGLAEWERFPHFEEFFWAETLWDLSLLVALTPLDALVPLYTLVAQCSATPASVAATPPCSATPFQGQLDVRHSLPFKDDRCDRAL